MDSDNRRLPEDEDVIPPDLMPRRDRPLNPADAIAADRERYGDSSSSPNRDDEDDVHRGQPDDIV
jgi:hypothetical protein